MGSASLKVDVMVSCKRLRMQEGFHCLRNSHEGDAGDAEKARQMHVALLEVGAAVRCSHNRDGCKSK